MTIKSGQRAEEAEKKATRKEMIIFFQVCKHQTRPGDKNLLCQNIASFGELNSGNLTLKIGHFNNIISICIIAQNVFSA